MRGDVTLRRMRAGVAADSHVGVVFVLIYTHVADEEFCREGLAEARIEATFAAVSLAVVLIERKKKQSGAERSH